MTISAAGVLSVAFLYRASGCYVTLYEPYGSDQIFADVPSEGETAVHFLDVGQGDSILICGSEKNVLIDGGEREYDDDVLAALKHYDVDTIDYIIATHPHSDHIGGLVGVLEEAAVYNTLDIKNVIIPDIPESDIPTTTVFSDFLDGVEANDLSITFAEYKTTIDLGSGTLTLYPPVAGENYSSLNDYSVCAHLQCGETSFFFAGDMEQPEETDLLEGGYLWDVEADVLKAGHHGSETSSSKAFLSQIDPEYVVISCGEGNKYGHPHSSAIERFKMFTDSIYRTDINGTITCVTDGENLTWTMKGD